jgi:hypothetical protein
MAKRTELPDVLRDPDLNRFITSVLESARSGDDGVFSRIADVQIDRTVEQLRAFFPEQYTGDGGNTGGNVHGGEGNGGNVSAFADRVGA